MPSVVAEKDAIQELMHEYCEAVDEPDPARVPELFTDDATFDVPSYGEGKGREDLAEFAANLTTLDHRVRSHNILNRVITVSGETAAGRWYYIVMYERTDGSVEFGQGRFEGSFRKVDGDWRIADFRAERRITVTV